MLCPHCRQNFHPQQSNTVLGQDQYGYWVVYRYQCPACNKMIFLLGNGEGVFNAQTNAFIRLDPDTSILRLVWPIGSNRPPCPSEVPKDIAEDYSEACIVFPYSTRASAALSRRCLQHLLHQQGFKDKNLDTEIQNAVKSGKLPTHLTESLDAIRTTGNFAAHPMKSTSSGEIVPVEPHEAEWNLDTLEQLFDFFYVQPALTQKKRAALNQKLAAAGKPKLK